MLKKNEQNQHWRYVLHWICMEYVSSTLPSLLYSKFDANGIKDPSAPVVRSFADLVEKNFYLCSKEFYEHVLSKSNKYPIRKIGGLETEEQVFLEKLQEEYEQGYIQNIFYIKDLYRQISAPQGYDNFFITCNNLVFVLQQLKRLMKEEG